METNSSETGKQIDLKISSLCSMTDLNDSLSCKDNGVENSNGSSKDTFKNSKDDSSKKLEDLVPTNSKLNDIKISGPFTSDMTVSKSNSKSDEVNNSQCNEETDEIANDSLVAKPVKDTLDLLDISENSPEKSDNVPSPATDEEDSFLQDNPPETKRGDPTNDFNADLLNNDSQYDSINSDQNSALDFNSGEESNSFVPEVPSTVGGDVSGTVVSDENEPENEPENEIDGAISQNKDSDMLSDVSDTELNFGNDLLETIENEEKNSPREVSESDVVVAETVKDSQDDTNLQINKSKSSELIENETSKVLDDESNIEQSETNSGNVSEDSMENETEESKEKLNEPLETETNAVSNESDEKCETTGSKENEANLEVESAVGDDLEKKDEEPVTVSSEPEEEESEATESNKNEANVESTEESLEKTNEEPVTVSSEPEKECETTESNENEANVESTEESLEKTNEEPVTVSSEPEKECESTESNEKEASVESTEESLEKTNEEPVTVSSEPEKECETTESNEKEANVESTEDGLEKTIEESVIASSEPEERCERTESNEKEANVDSVGDSLEETNDENVVYPKTVDSTILAFELSKTSSDKLSDTLTVRNINKPSDVASLDKSSTGDPSKDQDEQQKEIDDEICIEYDSSKDKKIRDEDFIDLTDDVETSAQKTGDDVEDMDYDEDFDPSSLLAVEHSVVDDDNEAVDKRTGDEPSDADAAKVAEPDDTGKSLEEITQSVLENMVDETCGDKRSTEETSPILPDDKTCTECRMRKGLKYQVLFQGKTHYLCSEPCFHSFRARQKLAPPPANLGLSSGKEVCSICKVELKGGLGFVPLDAESGKPVCSEECMKQFQQEHGCKQSCAECSANIEGRTKCLTWETMEFCNEDCLGKYQTTLGSFCACCKLPVQRLSLGKYCVRFGFDIRQFCSGKCLEEFKKGLKVCTFCQKDLTTTTEGFLAPVGNKGQFKDFCSQACMAQYETMNSSTRTAPKQKQCSVCSKMAPVKVQVTFNNKDHTLCSDPCVAAFRYANKIVTRICDTCNKFYKTPSSALQFEGTSKRFCSKNCMNLFVLSHRKIVPCTWCKVKKYNFDMIERVDSNNHVQLFCSLNCLSLFRVSLNATSSKSVACDHCKNNLPAQYHLTMSDASIRNFCTYQCVIAFQSQFTSVPTLTTVAPRTTSAPVPPTTTVTTVMISKSTPMMINTTPVISSVISLAPSNGPQGIRPATQPTILQTVRPSAPTITHQRQPLPTILGTIMTSKPSVSVPVVRAPAVVRAPVAPTTASTGTTTAVHVVREIVVRPTQPKMMKNKMILCKPLMQTKGVACKPHPCHKHTQTDAPNVTVAFIPIPVPVYIPVPMHMYSRQVPLPLPFPLPVPVPVFIPTTKATSEQIAKDINDIKDKIPDNPFEAELIMMADMVAADEKANPSYQIEDPTPSCDINSLRNLGKPDDNINSKLPEPILDLETALSLPTLESHLLQNLDDHANLSLASMSSVGDESSSEQLVTKEPTTTNKRGASRKRRGSSTKSTRGRKKTKGDTSEDSNELKPSLDVPFDLASRSTDQLLPSPDAHSVLKYMFGVNAWKHWVVQKNGQLEKGSRRLKLFKTDLLQLSPDEMNYSLCLFVKEVRKPNGEQYAADSIYYLTLGIQMYLFENGRVDNFFTDSYYEKFTECLNEVIQSKIPSVSREGHYVSRIEEEILWESKQLGAHSPHVLLNTLMYFNCKYFLLRSVDDHMQLTFSQVMKHWRKTSSSMTTGRGANEITIPAGTKVSVLRYYPPNPPGSKAKKEETCLEQVENVSNVLRCPVKLYEFYLSKCVKTRSEMFYLYPERSCVPDSPVWYSAQPLGRETISKMLNRIQMVREIM